MSMLLQVANGLYIRVIHHCVYMVNGPLQVVESWEPLLRMHAVDVQ